MNVTEETTYTLKMSVEEILTLQRSLKALLGWVTPDSVTLIAGKPPVEVVGHFEALLYNAYHGDRR